MRLVNPFDDPVIAGLMNTALPDFVLAFAFFTSIAYAVLGKRFQLQRPAIAMSAAIGLALSAGLVWWEQAKGVSIRNLGPIAVGFAIIVLALVIYGAIRQIGGSWAGAGIALGACILVANVLEISLPLAPQTLQTITVVALIAGVLAFLLHHRSSYASYTRGREPAPAEVRHDMSDLYRDRRVSKRLTKGLHKLRHETRDLNEHPEETQQVLMQLQRMLPAEGWLTQRMAELRAKAHRIRNGHIARLDETRDAFSQLPPSAKKRAAANLADRYNQIVGIDTRFERLDKAVAATEQGVRQLTRQAQVSAARHDYPALREALKAAERLQRHNSRLIKLIERTESRLSAVAKEAAREVKQVDPGN